jgi:uncharacterized protein YeaO (DUF488 family)
MNTATRKPRASAVQLKRAYEEAEERDGIRVLVDRLWPRGVSKDAAHLHAWMKDLGPSGELRTWFGHRPERWDGFQQRYQTELGTPLRQLLLRELASVAGDSTLTLVYGARDTRENEAVVIRDYLVSKQPNADGGWDDARRVLVTLSVVAAAQSGAHVATATLKPFLAAQLDARALEAALQALQSTGMVRTTASGWLLTRAAVEHMRQLSDAA